VYFLDEIQWVEGWQRWLRTQVERPRGRRFVITGSNAHLLAGELGSVLTGRHHTIELFPFDLGEYRELRPRATLKEFLDQGGFPATIGSPDHDRLLRGYFQDIVERDMRERVAARSSVPLRRLVQMLFESAGSELSVRRAAAALGVANDTTSLYVDAAESAYIALACPYFAWSERKRIVRNRKYYPIDTGLRHRDRRGSRQGLGNRSVSRPSPTLPARVVLARQARGRLRRRAPRHADSRAGHLGRTE
jgi:predicted AAA+ superfamily ATPase